MKNSKSFAVALVFWTACIVAMPVSAQWQQRAIFPSFEYATNRDIPNWTVKGDLAYSFKGMEVHRTWDNMFTLSTERQTWDLRQILEEDDSSVYVEDYYVIDKGRHILSLAINFTQIKSPERNMLVLAHTSGELEVVYESKYWGQTTAIRFCFMDSLHGFYFGGRDLTRNCIQILTTADGGKSWKEVEREKSFPFESGVVFDESSRLNVIYKYSRNWSNLGETGFVMVPIRHHAASFAVLKWSEWGNSWSLLDQPFLFDRNDRVTSFTAVSESYWYVMRRNHQESKTEFFYTEDAGLNWVKFKPDALGDDVIYDIIHVKPEPGSGDAPFLLFQTYDYASGTTSTYISFDSCRHIYPLDKKSHSLVSFSDHDAYLSFWSSRRGYQYISHSSGTGSSLKYNRQTYIFSYPKARSVLYPRITDTAYICRGEALHYSLPFPDPCYWSHFPDGSDTISLAWPLVYVPEKSGPIYLISAFHSDTLWVHMRERFPVGLIEARYDLCQGAEQLLQVPIKPLQYYSWNKESEAETYLASGNQRHSLHVMQGFYCDTVIEFETRHFQKYQFELDSGLCYDDFTNGEINFYPELQQLKFLAPVNQNQLTKFTKPTSEIVSFIDTNGCSADITFEIYSICPPEVFVPNAFHPQSGIKENRCFKPVTRHINSYKLSIYTIWGELVYCGTEQEMGWEGSFKNQLAPQGVYVYTLEYRYTQNRTEKAANQSGVLTLIR